MNTTDCKTCRTCLPELLLDAQAAPPGVAAHLASCAECQAELRELQATWALMEEWTAPEPSAFFDARLHARLREAQAAPPEGLWERLTAYLQFSTGRQFRPAMAGALALAMLLGGGTAATLLLHQGTTAPSVSSPTVNDLKIYDNNAQALQQMDLLDDAGSDAGTSPQS